MSMNEEMKNESNMDEETQASSEQELEQTAEINDDSGEVNIDVAEGISTEPASSLDLEDEEMEKLRKEAAEMKDAWTRERAEFMNFKKRVSQDQARLRIQAVTGFVKELLPVIDNLNRVVEASTDDPAVKDFITGVDMIRSEFMSVLEKEKIKRFSPGDEIFDPGSMEAIAMEPREGLEQDTVIEVYQDGFFLEMENGDRQVIRPARVKVGKPA